MATFEWSIADGLLALRLERSRRSTEDDAAGPHRPVHIAGPDRTRLFANANRAQPRQRGSRQTHSRDVLLLGSRRFWRRRCWRSHLQHARTRAGPRQHGVDDARGRLHPERFSPPHGRPRRRAPPARCGPEVRHQSPHGHHHRTRNHRPRGTHNAGRVLRSPASRSRPPARDHQRNVHAPLEDVHAEDCNSTRPASTPCRPTCAA